MEDADRFFFALFVITAEDKSSLAVSDIEEMWTETDGSFRLALGEYITSGQDTSWYTPEAKYFLFEYIDGGYSIKYQEWIAEGGFEELFCLNISSQVIEGSKLDVWKRIEIVMIMMITMMNGLNIMGKCICGKMSGRLLREQNLLQLWSKIQLHPLA